jgi:predicted ATPase
MEEAAKLAKRIGDPALLVEADHFAGVVSFHLGQFQFARVSLERSAKAGEYRGRYHSELYGINIGVFCRAYISHCDWHLGYPIRALKIAEEGLALAREISHPFSIVLALNYLAMLHQFGRDPDAALESATEARKICAEHGFDYYGAWSSLVRAWAIAESGQIDEGVTAYEAALEEFRRTSAGIRIPHHLMLMAALHRKTGKVMSGLRLIDQAIVIANATGESWCDAELHRERGELLLLATDAAGENQADAEFLVAIETAATQGAKLPELRATVARARLDGARGRRQKARDILEPIYGWFSEGFETRDLVQARTLLADLQSG